MKMLEKYRQKQFQKALHKRRQGVSRNIVNKNFEDSVTFLLLFDATSESRYNEFSRIQSALQLKGKTVYGAGYHGMPINPLYCMQSLHVSILGKNEISRYGIPLSTAIDSMLSQRVDVLVDLTRCMLPSFRWMTALSNASLKIGVAPGHCPCQYDFTIESENLVSQEDIMKQAIHYMNMFNNKPI